MFRAKETTPKPEIIRIPPPMIEFTLEKAIRYISGYCEKHDRCDDACRLYDEEEGCAVKSIPPCDWDLIMKEEELGKHE